MVIKLPIPVEGEMIIDKSFNFYGLNYKVTRAERRGDRVRVYVDSGYDEKALENIWRIDFYDMNQPIRSGVLNIFPAIYDNFNYDSIDYFDFVVKPNQKELKFRLGSLETIVKGSWTFEIPSDTIR